MCLLSPIYHSFDSNGSLCATSPERCALSGYCSSDFPQQDLLSISPRTLHVVLHITADYVLSFWSPPRGGFKSVLNSTAPAFYRYSTQRPSLCYDFPLDSYLYSHAQPSTVDTQSAKPYSYSSTCTTWPMPLPIGLYDSCLLTTYDSLIPI